MDALIPGLAGPKFHRTGGLHRPEGGVLKEAVIQASLIRFRLMLLTAAVVAGSSVILSWPYLSGYGHCTYGGRSGFRVPTKNWMKEWEMERSSRKNNKPHDEGNHTA